MVHVVLAQIRKARNMGLADDLRMERDLVHHCFHLRESSETVEGIRALAVDKDHQPQWAHSQIADVSSEEWPLFFNSPWTAETHPLRHLT
jgi:enoyl-CoA hydratase